jgi:hypothetical protein
MLCASSNRRLAHSMLGFTVFQNFNRGAIAMHREVKREAGRGTSSSVRQGANPKTIRAEVEGVFPLMQQQYYDLISRRRIIDGERRLMFCSKMRSVVT